MTSLCRRHFRTQLGRPWDISPKFMRHWINSIVLLSGGTLKLYFKNVRVINFIVCVKLRFSRFQSNIITWKSPRSTFHTSFGCFSKVLCKYRSCFLCLLLHVYLYIYMSTYNQYWKHNDIEMHFKKYA